MTNSPHLLPRHISEITAAWLTTALERQHPGIKVASFEIVDVVASTSTKVRLRLAYDESGPQYALPSSMILKGGLAGLPHEANLQPLYRNEGTFYRDVSPSLKIKLPTCFYADTDGEVGLILLEDLADAKVTFGGGATPLAPETVAAALDYQASYHATWWNSDDSPLAKLMPFESFLTWFWSQPWLVGVGPENIRRAKPGDSLLVQARAAVSDLATYRSAVMAAHRYNHASSQCLLHVDPHPGNMYFDARGTPRWLDWQIASRGNWAWDVAYFMIGALTISDRRKLEKPLLHHYLDRLKHHGVALPPTWDDAWLAYRRNAIWGISWALVPEEMQSSRHGDPIIERFAAAIKDLDTLANLGLPIGAYDFDLSA